jgi:hypothetical protein
MQRPEAYIDTSSDYQLSKAKELSRKFRVRLLATTAIAQHLRECVQALEESNADLRAKLAEAKKVTKLT